MRAVNGTVVRTLAGLALALATVATEAGGAGPLDGAKPLQCAIQAVMVCSDPSICVRGTAQTVNLPPVLQVDVEQRRMGGATTGRTIKITSVSRGSGRILLHGEDVHLGGSAWNMVIVEASGSMTAAALGHGSGFLVFGACSN
jgi:hypothetical protein